MSIIKCHFSCLHPFPLFPSPSIPCHIIERKPFNWPQGLGLDVTASLCWYAAWWTTAAFAALLGWPYFDPRPGEECVLLLGCPADEGRWWGAWSAVRLSPAPTLLTCPPWEQPRGRGRWGPGFRGCSLRTGCRFILPSMGLWNSFPPLSCEFFRGCI